MLRTFLTREWGLRHPILNASMIPAAGGALARAVSDAGGLGMIGIDAKEPLEAIVRAAETAREGDGERRFGFGLMAWTLAGRPELLEAVIAARPFAICISFGDLAPHAERVRGAGIKLLAQVQDRRSAEAAIAAGAEVIIAQGTEAGGHTGNVGTLPLLQIVLEVAAAGRGGGGCPVLAAGGIASPRGLAAVLTAGADGVWVGTPFLLASEARVPEAARARLLASDETATVLTSLFDRVQNIPWPKEFRGRALANEFTARWHGNEDAAAADAAAVRAFTEARAAGRYETAHIYAGQSVGMLEAVRPAGEIVRGLGEGAERWLVERAREMLGPR